ncbi:MAG: 2OG-Fe(II) oxygenase [Rhizomicrobium sp.]|jgi:Flp pilus assembly protein TadD
MSDIRHRLVGNREAYLCDDFADEATIARVAELLRALQYRRVERSRPGTDPSGGSAEVPEQIANSEPLFARMKAFAEHAFGVESMIPQRLYVNSTVYGDMYYPHRDFGLDQPHITALFYANPKWNADWGGETMLYSDDGDAQLAVTPRPGRILAFRGAILHRGGVPTRICFEERLTIAYKLRIPQVRGSEPVVNAAEAGGVPLASAALLAEQAGRDEDALAAYQQALVQNPRDPQIISEMGMCLIRLSRFQEAIYAFDELVRINPALSSTHHQLGLALGLAGKWDVAERAHARAAQLDPRNPDAIAHAGIAAFHRGDKNKARAQAERALKLDAANASGQIALALLEAGEGQRAAAVARLKPLAETSHLPGHVRMVARAALREVEKNSTS